MGPYQSNMPAEGSNSAYIYKSFNNRSFGRDLSNLQGDSQTQTKRSLRLKHKVGAGTAQFQEARRWQKSQERSRDPATRNAPQSFLATATEKQRNNFFSTTQVEIPSINDSYQISQNAAQIEQQPTAPEPQSSEMHTQNQKK